MPASANGPAGPGAAIDAKRRDEVAAAIVRILNRHGGAAHRDVVREAFFNLPRMSAIGRDGTLLETVFNAFESDGRPDTPALFHRPLGPDSHYWALLPSVLSRVSGAEHPIRPARRRRGA